jgi:N-acyl-D-aspartate/D-glutamate deacylase
MHHGMGYAHGNLDAERDMLASPFTVIGGADGGARVAIICDASMPSFLLTHWARDRVRGERLPLEFLVKKQTQDTARLFGLSDRGRLAPGLRADINLIDHANLRLTRPALVHDLPTGAPRLMQIADGIVATYVAGEAVRSGNEDTGARPGRLLRSRAT